MVDSPNGIDDKVAYFQAITGLDDRALSIQILEAHGWDLDSAISEITDDENSSSANLASGSANDPSSVGNFTSGPWEGIEGSNVGGNQVVAHPGTPRIAWRIVTLPFSIARGSFGLLSGAIGFGMWVAGGVLSHSLNAIGWGSGELRPGQGEESAPLASMSVGTAEALAFINLFEREYGNFHPAF